MVAPLMHFDPKARRFMDNFDEEKKKKRKKPRRRKQKKKKEQAD